MIEREPAIPLPAVLSVCCGAEIRRIVDGGWFCPVCKRLIGGERPEPNA